MTAVFVYGRYVNKDDGGSLFSYLIEKFDLYFKKVGVLSRLCGHKGRGMIEIVCIL